MTVKSDSVCVSPQRWDVREMSWLILYRNVSPNHLNRRHVRKGSLKKTLRLFLLTFLRLRGLSIETDLILVPVHIFRMVVITESQLVVWCVSGYIQTNADLKNTIVMQFDNAAVGCVQL